MNSMHSERQDLERHSQVLADQAERLIKMLGIDVSEVKSEPEYSLAFQQAEESYERLSAVSKKTKPKTWEDTMVDGRNGDELMSRLWPVRQELFRQDSAKERT
jgi:hypothetical protein